MPGEILFVRRTLCVIGWCLAALVAVAGAFARFRVAPIPLADPDTWGYIHPAMSLFGGHGFEQASGRDWLYPAMVVAGLKITGSFSGLALIQQTLGVLSGVLFWLVLRAWLVLLPAGVVTEAAMAVLGPVAMAIYLLNPRTIFFELNLRPEAVFGFFGFAQLLCVMIYLHAGWRSHKESLAFVTGLLACVLAYACVLLKPSWAFAAAFTTLPVVVGVFGGGVARWVRWGTLPMALVLSLALLWLPAKLMYRHDSASGTFLSATLFCIHAKEVLGQMEKREAQLPVGDPEKAFLDGLLPVFRAQFAKASANPGIYRHLGYDPDYLMYGSPLLAWIMTNGNFSDAQLSEWCRSWYVRAVIGDPAGIAEKVGGQLAYFFGNDPGLFFGRTEVLNDDYATSLASLPRVETASWIGGVYGRYLEELKIASSVPAQLPAHQWVFETCRNFFARTRVADLVFLLFLAACLFWPGGRDLRLAGLAACVLFCAPFGNALTVSIIHALDMSRYRYTYSGFLLLALVAMVVFCLSVIARASVRKS